MATISEVGPWGWSEVDEPELVIPSVFPRDEFRVVSTARVASILGGVLAGHRASLDVRSVVLGRMSELGVGDAVLSPVQGVSREEMISLVLGRVKRDRVFDSEDRQASRGFAAVLSMLFGDSMRVRGWLPGLGVRHGGDVFELTGSKCRRCFVNPEAYGHGGGIRCLDVKNCGYWFCA